MSFRLFVFLWSPCPHMSSYIFDMKHLLCPRPRVPAAQWGHTPTCCLSHTDARDSLTSARAQVKSSFISPWQPESSPRAPIKVNPPTPRHCLVHVTVRGPRALWQHEGWRHDDEDMMKMKTRWRHVSWRMKMMKSPCLHVSEQQTDHSWKDSH